MGGAPRDLQTLLASQTPQEAALMVKPFYWLNDVSSIRSVHEGRHHGRGHVMIHIITSNIPQ